MKFPCEILWKGVLHVEPLKHVCTDLKISNESNVLIQVIIIIIIITIKKTELNS